MLGIGEQLIGFLTFCFLIIYFLPLYLAITCLVAAIGSSIQYLRHDKSYWKKAGVSGPEPNLIMGNLGEFGKGMHLYDIECTKKYGPTFGSYLLGKYDICSSDLNILRQVMVKDFNCFVDRLNIISTDRTNNHNLAMNMITVKEGEDWKRVRNLLTPAFTTGKLKLLMPEVNNCSLDLVKIIDKYAEEKKDIPLKEIISKFTLSVIVRTTFGVEVNAFDEKEGPVLKNARELFTLFNGQPNLHILFLLTCPNIAKYIEKYTDYSFFAPKQSKFFKQVLEELFEERKKDPEASKKYHDFFQLMLNCLEDDDQNENITKNEKYMSKIEILAQSFGFLLAAYDTTSFALHMVFYVLAKLPEIQEKVREEIYEVVGDKDDVSYEDLTKLHYLSQVIQETLRMYPPTARTNRTCTEEIIIGGIQFKPQFTFSVPVYVIHYDERYYPEPEKFDPDRFLPDEKSKRDPLTYLPFGYGPRNCIGMRFADLEMRMAVVHLIKRFNFTPANDAPDLPVKINTSSLTRTEQVLYVNAEKI